MLLGQEAMVPQGFPIAAVSYLVERTDNNVMADPAGNMVAAPVLLVLFMAAVACVHWRVGVCAAAAVDVDSPLSRFFECSSRPSAAFNRADNQDVRSEWIGDRTEANRLIHELI